LHCHRRTAGRLAAPPAPGKSSLSSPLAAASQFPNHLIRFLFSDLQEGKE
jgi:hypothetical protein